MKHFEKKTYLVIFVISWFVFHALSLTAQDPQRASFENKCNKLFYSDRLATHCMLIFLDDSESESEPGVVTMSLLKALEQKSCPMLVSAYALHTIVAWPNLEKISSKIKNKEYFKTIVDRYNTVQKRIQVLIAEQPNLDDVRKAEIVRIINDESSNYRSLWDPELSEIEKALMKETLNNPFDGWIVKQVTTKLFLLVPKTYRTMSYAADLATPRPRSMSLSGISKRALTDVEYKTGLKLDHMRTLHTPNKSLEKSHPKKEDASYFVTALMGTQSDNTHTIHTSDIFVSRAEYNQKNSEDPAYEIPRWAFCMLGHGIVGNICRLSINDFKRVLDFFDTSINTGFLAYASCYAVGTNMDRAYKDLEQRTKIYSFPIVTQGTTDKPTQGSYVRLEFGHRIPINAINFDARSLALLTWFDSSAFVNNVTARDVYDFAKVIEPVMGPLQSTNIPHIRLPGSEWFTIINSSHKIAALGSVFAKTCTVVDLAKRFSYKGVPANYYLLYSPIIPCELILPEQTNDIPGGATPCLIPMARHAATGTYMYYIRKISAPKIPFDTLVPLFVQGVSFDWHFQLWIDEVESKDEPPRYDVIVDTKKQKDMHESVAQGMTLITRLVHGNVYYRYANDFYEFKRTPPFFTATHEKLDYDYREKFKTFKLDIGLENFKKECENINTLQETLRKRQIQQVK